jgi:hypothetical protein
VALLSTENVKLEFADEAVREIARVAALVNRTVENIGARRLHTVLERIVEVRPAPSRPIPSLDLGGQRIWLVVIWSSTTAS